MTKNELNTLHEFFRVSSSSITGIEWKVSPNKGIEPGHPAGTKTSKGYYETKLKGKRYKCHKLVLLLSGVFPYGENSVIDHIDRDRSNNKLSNLRWVTKSQNQFNREVQGSVPWKYVSRTRRNKFEARYRIPGKKSMTHVGTFLTAYEAHLAALSHRLENFWRLQQLEDSNE